jgi:hypothetical protein
MAITLLKRFQKIPLYPGDKPGTQDADILGALAIAQKFPGVRRFFVATTKVLMRGNIKGLAGIAKSKDIEDIVRNFTKAEANMYSKTLVRVGFPQLIMERGKVVGFLSKTARKAKLFVSKIGKPTQRKLASKKIAKALEQHIDFLKEESFFQKAHRAAQQENLITRDERTREFYHDYAAEYGVNYRSLQMLRTGGRRTGDIKIGRMYFFRYDAEGTPSGRGVDIKKGNVYDKFPLIFLLSEEPDSLEGINFHYMVPKERIKLLGRMFEYLNNQNFDNRTKLFSRKFRKIIQKNRVFRYAKVCYREYKPGRIASKIIQVHPMDWELAITVPTERFVTPAGGRVASKRIWIQTKKLARAY